MNMRGVHHDDLHDEKKEQQDRDNEAERWRRLASSQILMQRRGWKSWPIWKKISGFTEEDKAKAAKEKAQENETLSQNVDLSTAGSKKFTDGTYALVGGETGYTCNIEVKDGKFRPIPPPTDEDCEEAYRHVIDALASDGSDTLVIELGPEKGARFSKERLEIICKLAEEAGMAIVFGPNLTAYMHSKYSADEVIKFEAIRQQLEVNALITQTLTEVHNSSFGTYDTIFKGTEKLPDAKKQEYKDTKLDSLENISQEQQKISDRLAKLNEALAGFQSHQNACTSLLAEPDKLKRPTVPEMNSYFRRFKNFASDVINKHEKLSENPKDLTNQLCKTRNDNKSNREKLLLSMEEERKDLKTRAELCKEKIGPASADDDKATKDLKAKLISQNDGFTNELKDDGTLVNSITERRDFDKKIDEELKKTLDSLQAPSPSASASHT